MNKISIDKVNFSEAGLLAEISRNTFYEAFIWGNTEVNIQEYIQKAFNEEQLLSELSNPASEFYFARSDENVIGYLKINFGTAQTEESGNSLEIERIYVLKDFRGMHVGQKLFDYAVNRARDLNKISLWLGVWEKNEAAIRFYKRNGLEPFSSHVFKVGDDKQTDIMMKMSL